MEITEPSLADHFDLDFLYNDSSYGYFFEEAYPCDPDEGKYHETELIPVRCSVIFIVGVLCNGMLLGVLARSRRAWSVTDTFIFHLGVADVLLLLTLPFFATQVAQDQGWTFGTPLCKIIGAVFRISLYCGIFLLVCLSLDQYLSIVHAIQMYSHMKPWAVRISCLAVWLLSLILSLPDWIFLEASYNGLQNQTECTHNYFQFQLEEANWYLASQLLYHIMGFLLPSAVVIFSYSCILLRLCCGSQGLQKPRAFRVIMAVVMVFFLCWTPLNIALLVGTFLPDPSCWMLSSLQQAMIVTLSLGYLHCCLNPILYAFIGVKFQHRLLDTLRSLGCQLKTVGQTWSESGDTSNSTAV